MHEDLARSPLPKQSGLRTVPQHFANLISFCCAKLRYYYYFNNRACVSRVFPYLQPHRHQAMPSHITDLPVELFLDNILLLLPVPDLLNLGRANIHFAQLTSDETFWHRKLQEDFNFTGSETARKNGWKFLYSRLSHPHVFVWGYALMLSVFWYQV